MAVCLRRLFHTSVDDAAKVIRTEVGTEQIKSIAEIKSLPLCVLVD